MPSIKELANPVSFLDSDTCGVLEARPTDVRRVDPPDETVLCLIAVGVESPSAVGDDHVEEATNIIRQFYIRPLIVPSNDLTSDTSKKWDPDASISLRRTVPIIKSFQFNHSLLLPCMIIIPYPAGICMSVPIAVDETVEPCPH
jgi:hypothetical protein